MEKKKIVFLYTELATYFMACVAELAKKRELEITIFRWPVNQEAPFDFDFPENIHVFSCHDFNAETLNKKVDEIAPDLIYVSGWLDKKYLSVCKKYRSKIPVVVGIDNQWVGSAKQRIACLTRWVKIHPYFSHAWVSGPLQFTFAQKLGFSDGHILSGVYSCDFSWFQARYFENRRAKEIQFPKRFLFVGRYVAEKGIQDLWNAFIQVANDSATEWELWCLGTGPLEPIKHPQIKHFGFVQPSAMDEFIANCGVFVLPSHFEPWGVVIHEFAAAGFPLICSDKVGARTVFVKDEINGYIYNSGNEIKLADCLRRIMHSPPSELLKMGDESNRMAKSITPGTWAATLMNLL